MKQSPAPQHHSPAALQWLPRLIQESCARVSQPTHAVSTIAATKIRIGDEGRSQVWLRWPRIAGAVPHPCRDRSTPRGGPSAFPHERDAEHGAPAADLRPPKVYSGSASTSTIATTLPSSITRPTR